MSAPTNDLRADQIAGPGRGARVCAVIPCYNQSHFLRDSVGSVIAQDYPRLEIIVVNDGSPDDPAAAIADLIADDPRIRLVHQPNGGLANARNRGFREASRDAELFLFLDADDRLEPGAIRELVEAIAFSPAAPAVYGVARFIDAEGAIHRVGEAERWTRRRHVVDRGRLRLASLASPTTFEMLAYRNPIFSTGQALIRRDALVTCGLFDETQNGTADWDLWLRLASRAPIPFTDRIILSYRRHGANMSDAPLMRRHELALRRKSARNVAPGDPRLGILRDGFRLSEREHARALLRVIMDQARRRRFLSAAKYLRRCLVLYCGSVPALAWFGNAAGPKQRRRGNGGPGIARCAANEAAVSKSPHVYGRVFFEAQKGTSYLAAQEIAPFIMELVRPSSVVDVGCGIGAWLSVFQKLGCQQILGIDGDYVDRGMLLIPWDAFVARDLRQPLMLDRSFDLAVSLEVAEHLPPESADTFVDSLTRLAPVVVFSAAVPHQGGVEHLNEQWPEYWAEKFDARGFQVIDCVRPRIWDNPRGTWHYAQNTLLYIRRTDLPRYPQLQRERELRGSQPLSRVHPEMYRGLVFNTDPSTMSLRAAWRVFAATLGHAVRRKLGIARSPAQRGRTAERGLACR